MLLWIAVTIAALAAAAWIARPFLRRGTMEMDAADSTISIYRDQLAEIERDLDSGQISDEECEAARKEIERRALAAARTLDQGFYVGRRSVPVAAAVIAISTLAAVGVYAYLGSPESPDRPLAGRRSEMLAEKAAAGDINSSIQLLVDSTKENPEDFETWWLLARSYASVGDNASSADAYRRAAELSGDDPAVLSAYGEAMTLANGNKVPAAARVIFEQVLQKQPDTRARYYIALAKAQAQDFEGAVSDWAALAAESGPDAPWMPMVRRDIVNMARFLKRDVGEFLPDATRQEIAAAGGISHEASSSERIAELEAAVAADPSDWKAWIALAGQQAGLGNAEAALTALEDGRRNFRAAPFVLQKFDEASRSLGLDMLDDGRGVSGPTSEDIAAAADLSQQEQQEMIDGMVAGLAAKLEENPNNPDGWIMLVRSYANLGRLEKANDAYEAAMAHYASNAAVLNQIRLGAGSVIGAN